MPNINTVIDLPRHRFGDISGLSLEPNLLSHKQTDKHTESHMEVAPPPKNSNRMRPSGGSGCSGGSDCGGGVVAMVKVLL